MKIIVGLGNPGKKYELTRHNFGFIVLNSLANFEGVNFKSESRFKADISTLDSGNEKLFLVKPLTYMNDSGKSITKIINFYKIDQKDILLVYDDLDLDFGKIRRTGRGSGGHRGVESIFQSLETNNLNRIRLGINNGSKLPAEEFVLQKFTLNEQSSLNKIIELAITEIHQWIETTTP